MSNLLVLKCAHYNVIRFNFMAIWFEEACQEACVGGLCTQGFGVRERILALITREPTMDSSRQDGERRMNVHFSRACTLAYHRINNVSRKMFAFRCLKFCIVRSKISHYGPHA